MTAPARERTATHYLVGNGEPCPACALRREALGPDTRAFVDAPRHVECQLCEGSGVLPLPDAEIVRRAVAWAREHYWPAFDARNGLAPPRLDEGG